jgi:hypothetical protein
MRLKMQSDVINEHSRDIAEELWKLEAKHPEVDFSVLHDKLKVGHTYLQQNVQGVTPLDGGGKASG